VKLSLLEQVQQTLMELSVEKARLEVEKARYEAESAKMVRDHIAKAIEKNEMPPIKGWQ
jgi:cob(I)alamin adenosyltransferase